MRCPAPGDNCRHLRLVLSFLAVLLCTVVSARADTLQGRVLDPAGQPVQGAEVLVLRGAMVVSSTTTTADGHYGPLALPPGRYDITIVAAGLRPLPATVTIAEAAPVTLDLRTALAAVEESVLVSAAHVETARSRTASSASVLTRSDLDTAQIRTVAEAMRLIPGFYTAPSGTTGAQTSLFPRGGEADYTLVLIDGVPQNAFGGAFDAAHTATANIDRLEVVRGPQSALYGSGAIGGIVHLVTANGGRPRMSATFEGGGAGTRAGTASAATSHGSWSLGGGFDWLESDGETRAVASIGGPVTNDDYARVSASGSVAWSDDPSRRIRLDVRGGRNERGFPGPYGSDPEGLFGGLDTISRGENTHTSIAGEAMFRSRGALDHRVQITRASTDGTFLSPWSNEPSVDALRRLTARYQLDFSTRGIGMSAGSEVLREEARSSFVLDQDAAMLPVERSNLGLFVEARPALGDRLLATLGVRAERIARSQLLSDGFRPDLPSSVVWSTNPKASLTWLARRTPDGAVGSTTLRAAAGTGIKPPTAFDIAFTDNPDLRPERSRSVEVGVEQALGGTRGAIDATWFYNSYDDLIVTISQPLSDASRYQSDNIANARSTGVEVGAAWRHSRALAARVSWTWLHTEILGVDSLPQTGFGFYEVGDSLIRRPRHAASAELNWKTRRASAFVLLHHRGAMRDLEPNWASTVYTNPGRVLTTMGAAWSVAPNFEVYGRVINAFDRNYEDVLGFPAARRTAIVGLRIAAGR